MSNLKTGRSKRAEEILEKTETVSDAEFEITDAWLRENIEIKQYVKFISKEQKQKTYDAICRYDDYIISLIERGILKGEYIHIKDKSEYEQLVEIRDKLKGFYDNGDCYVSFEGREDVMMDNLLKKDRERLVNDYKPLVKIIDKTKWYNSFILQLPYSSEIKKMLFLFCIKTNAKQNNMILIKDFEYMQYNKIEENVLMLCIQNAMQERYDAKGNSYRWKALYLKEGVNV